MEYCREVGDGWEYYREVGDEWSITGRWVMGGVLQGGG